MSVKYRSIIDVRSADNRGLTLLLSACVRRVLHYSASFNLRNTTYPAPEHVYDTVQVPLESVHDLAS